MLIDAAVVALGKRGTVLSLIVGRLVALIEFLSGIEPLVPEHIEWHSLHPFIDAIRPAEVWSRNHDV